MIEVSISSEYNQLSPTKQKNDETRDAQHRRGVGIQSNNIIENEETESLPYSISGTLLDRSLSIVQFPTRDRNWKVVGGDRKLSPRDVVDN